MNQCQDSLVGSVLTLLGREGPPLRFSDQRSGGDGVFEGVASLEDVKERITETLGEQMRGKAIDDFVDGLRGKAQIEEV